MINSTFIGLGIVASFGKGSDPNTRPYLSGSPTQGLIAGEAASGGAFKTGRAYDRTLIFADLGHTNAQRIFNCLLAFNDRRETARVVAGKVEEKRRFTEDQAAGIGGMLLRDNAIENVDLIGRRAAFEAHPPCQGGCC